MIKVKEGDIKSAVEKECGEIAHSAGPAVFLMTSLSCGFHENQTCSRSCFHSKSNCFGDLYFLANMLDVFKEAFFNRLLLANLVRNISTET